MSDVEIYDINPKDIPDDIKKEIISCFNQHECEFDLQTVVNFCKGPKGSKSITGTQKLFSVYLKNDRSRVEAFYAERYNKFVDQNKVKAAEEKLDPGF